MPDALRSSFQVTDEQQEVIFQRRAEALAAAPPPSRPADAFEALVFGLGEERYAFPSSHVREVRCLDGLTALPSAPAFVAGLVNVRGRIVPVIDLRPFFGIGSKGGAAESVLLVAAHDSMVGVLTTGQPGIAWLRTSELGPLPAHSATRPDPTYVRGVTPELIVLLDAVRLFENPKLLVQEDME